MVARVRSAAATGGDPRVEPRGIPGVDDLVRAGAGAAGDLHPELQDIESIASVECVGDLAQLRAANANATP